MASQGRNPLPAGILKPFQSGSGKLDLHLLPGPVAEALDGVPHRADREEQIPVPHLAALCHDLRGLCPNETKTDGASDSTIVEDLLYRKPDRKKVFPIFPIGFL